MSRNYSYYINKNHNYNNVLLGKNDEMNQKRLSRRPLLTSQKADTRGVNLEGTSLSKRRTIEFPKSEKSQINIAKDEVPKPYTTDREFNLLNWKMKTFEKFLIILIQN